EALGSAGDAIGGFERLADAEVGLEAAVAPFLDEGAGGAGVGGRAWSLARGLRANGTLRVGSAWRTGAVGEAGLDAVGGGGADGVVDLDPLLAGTAEKLVDGLAGGLAGDVPQRDVDAGDGAHSD